MVDLSTVSTSPQVTRIDRKNSLLGIQLPDAPWCWYIYLQNWVILRENVGKYSIHGASGTGYFLKLISELDGLILKVQDLFSVEYPNVRSTADLIHPIQAYSHVTENL